MVFNMINDGVNIHALRDITRGGLGTILNELADASGTQMDIYEEKLPIDKEVEGFCKILGLDPMYMGNEGKLALVVPAEDADRALNIIRNSKYGESAAVIGNVVSGSGVVMHTKLGGRRGIGVLVGEGLPRIC